MVQVITRYGNCRKLLRICKGSGIVGIVGAVVSVVLTGGRLTGITREIIFRRLRSKSYFRIKSVGLRYFSVRSAGRGRFKFHTRLPKASRSGISRSGATSSGTTSRGRTGPLILTYLNSRPCGRRGHHCVRKTS